jgi:transglutaminase superfamily protein
MPQPQIHVARDLIAPAQDIDLELTNIPPLGREPEMPPPDLIRWRVAFYVVSETNKDDFWKAEGKIWDKETKEFVGHDGGVREAVSRTVSPSDSTEQKIRKIYAFVANLENWDYVPERSESEKKELNIKKDDNTADVLKNKGGTHSDLNRLFASMVRAAGVPAYMMWVPDRSEQLFDDNFLSERQFAAEIAIVQIDGKEVFLDPGSKFCPYGMLDWRYSGVRGLRQTANSAEIGETPAANYNQSITTRAANLQLATDGTAQGVVTLTFMGLEAMKRRQDAGLTDDTGRRKLLEDELRMMLPSDSDVLLAREPDWNNPETPLAAAFKVRVPLAVSAGKRLLVTQHLFEVNSTAKFAETQRQYAVYFDYPWHEVDETHISLPPGMEVENLARDESTRLEYATYKSQHKQEAPGKLFCRREFVMASQGIPVADYNEVKTFFDNVKADDDQTALVRPTQNAAATN